MAEQDAAPVQPAAPEKHDTPPPTGPVVVGIGASAGGLRAVKEFFATVPEDSGLAFVVVVHLSPDHESHLADLLQAHCAVPVTQVTGETQIEPNRVYVIPPGRNLSAIDSHLRLAPLAEARMGRAPVDHFFRTLAETHDGSSVGVILSGSGSDGTGGIRYIRGAGGLAVAQDPQEAEYDGMARSAIAAGSVDRVLPISAMMSQILEFARARPDLEARADGVENEQDAAAPADLLQTVLTLVRLRTGHDFLRYKRSTVARRVARRMQLLNVGTLTEYLDTLRADPREASILLDDLLINVTSFFRDPEVFRILEAEVIPGLFDGRSRGEALRVWSVGCATGEEAYTLGMLLLEEASRRPDPPTIQVFATDLHEPSLQYGREALFSDMIEAEITPERLERFFRRESGGYRVTKELRDVVVFATHNLLRDPPFSRQDLIVCRNVLIYLQRDVQEEVVEAFHYALRPGGRLMLGTAEILDHSELFAVESKAAHLYRRRDGHRGTLRFPVAAPAAFARVADPDPRGQRPASPSGYGILHQRMLERYAPPSILVGSDQGVTHQQAAIAPFHPQDAALQPFPAARALAFPERSRRQPPSDAAPVPAMLRATADALAAAPVRNRLLRALPRAELEEVQRHLEPVRLHQRQLLFEAEEPIRHVYFPETMVVSLVSRLRDGSVVEVGTAGFEGMAGLPLFLGDESSSVRAFAQVPGAAMRMDAGTFVQLAGASSALHRILLRYTQAFLTQVSQTAACNAAHLVPQRCARWLLMTHDRVNESTLPLTHEFLAFMLSVRRAGVTIAMSALQEAGLIRYGRGWVEVIDRAGLEAASCECYALVRAHTERLLPRGL